MKQELGDIITGEKAIKYAIDRYFTKGTEMGELGKEITFKVYNGYDQLEMLNDIAIKKDLPPIILDIQDGVNALEANGVIKQDITGAAELLLYDKNESVLYVNNPIDKRREMRHRLTIQAFQEATKDSEVNVVLEEKNISDAHNMNEAYESKAREYVSEIKRHLIDSYGNGFRDVMRNILIAPVYLPIESWYLPEVFDSAINKDVKGVKETARDIAALLEKKIAQETFGKDSLSEVQSASSLFQRQVKSMTVKELAKENGDIEELMHKALDGIYRNENDYLNFQILPIGNEHVLNLGYVYGGQAQNVLHYIFGSFDPGESVKLIYTGKAGNLHPEGSIQSIILGDHVISDDYIENGNYAQKKIHLDNMLLSNWKVNKHHPLNVSADMFDLSRYEGCILNVGATVTERREDMMKAYQDAGCMGVEMELLPIMRSILTAEDYINIKRGMVLWSSDTLNTQEPHDLSNGNIGKQGAYFAIDMAKLAFEKEFRNA